MTELIAWGANNQKQISLKADQTTIQVTKIPLETSEDFREIGGGSGYTIRWMSDDQIYYLYKRNKKKITNISGVEKIAYGYDHALFLTQDNKVYILIKNTANQSGFGTTTSEYLEPTELPFFKDKKVIDVRANFKSSYIIVEGGTMFGCGFNSKGGIGQDTNTQVNNFVQVDTNISRMFGGVDSEGIIYEKSDGSFYGLGKNTSGQLGTGTSVNAKLPAKIEFLSNKPQVIDVALSLEHTLAIIEENNQRYLYSTGHQDYCGFGRTTHKFEKLEFFDDKKVEQIGVGCFHSIVKTYDTQIYVWGKNSSKQLGIGRVSTVPALLKINDLDENKYYKIASFSNGCCAYTCSSISVNSDFLNLFEKQFFSDFQVFDFKVHKFMIKLRTGDSPESFKDKIEENFKKNEAESVFLWIYGNSFQDIETLQKFWELFKIPDPKKKTLVSDLKKKFHDEESKNFDILVKIDDENEDEDEEDDFEEIPVHKLVLLTRSALFREMFLNIEQNTEQVKDFSGKTIESVEHFIKFLYYEEFELTADDDPELICDELEDAAEYYQLSDNRQLKRQLAKIKKQFNLK
ncbi:hypothetical protein M0812_11414 [Anaeramoeba flamelloides]|uniref:BTB domain-containing protein n=1 Tax=Anaeramoeba flamelloides TaxID=1746091 RepID=A0AAV7ZY51_9EUKA|nr:hypothetical protein M0812_11414 [Anaeramoeba flamelloides]